MSDATYDLGPAIPDPEARRVTPGTSILIAGPPGTDKRDLALELLAAGQRRADGVLVIGTELGARPLVAAYEAAGGTDDDRLRVIDATGFGTDGPRVVSVPSPADLTELGSAISRSVEPYVTMDTEGLRVGTVSVTAMLEALDRGTVFKFLHTLGERVDRANYLGIATLDTAEVNEQTVGMISETFDVVIELRDGRDGTEFRALGADGAGDWSSLAL